MRCSLHTNATRVLTLACYRTVQLHNSLVISLFDITSHLKPQPPAPPPPPKATPRKRRRTLPYQSLDGSDQNTLRSARLKKWALSIGKKERERVKAYEDGGPSIPRPLPGFQDEITQERGVVLLPERTGEGRYYLVNDHTLNSKGKNLQVHGYHSILRLSQEPRLSNTFVIV